ncbi:MAG TPA: 6,7-dimethyl-8-ribityllumazine synthase [Terriglobia bacterium]|nr:6,7-dimethyl-8-ribityllumazine synthase [Terriglobia bacterium]
MRLKHKKVAATKVRLAPHGADRIRIAIIRAEYNNEITQSLREKCEWTLIENGVPAAHIDHYSVPGCFEIPLIAQKLAAQQRYDAFIALGAVIRGDTHHFELVANGCARGVMEVSLKHGVPIIFEVLATYNRRDALRRAGDNSSNKGVEAAEAALSMLAALGKLEK